EDALSSMTLVTDMLVLLVGTRMTRVYTFCPTVTAFTLLSSAGPMAKALPQWPMQCRNRGQHTARRQRQGRTGQIGHGAAGLPHDHGQRGNVQDVDVGFDHDVERATRQQVVVTEVAVAARAVHLVDQAAERLPGRRILRQRLDVAERQRRITHVRRRRHAHALAVEPRAAAAPRTKLLVPSSGSTSHRNAPSPSRPRSSPRIACSGNACFSAARMMSSASRSAMVTGVASGLISTATPCRKCCAMRSPAARAAASAISSAWSRKPASGTFFIDASLPVLEAIRGDRDHGGMTTTLSRNTPLAARDLAHVWHPCTQMREHPAHLPL